MNEFKDLIIFEMANSHQGSVGHGINIIKEIGKIARKHNIKAAVKLQYRNLETFIHPDFKTREDVKHIPRFLSTKLNYDQFCELVNVIKEEGLVTMSTPFDEDGIVWCMDQGIDIIKIASCSSKDWPLLEKAAQTDKPLIISTGGCTTADIDKLYNFFGHRKCNFAFLHCVAEYPAPIERLQLDYIEKMKKRYRGITIGYSGHEDPDSNVVAMMAVAKGAEILERHVGLPTDTITLNNYSMNPIQAEKWVESILGAREMCYLKRGREKYISQEEIDSLASLKRGVYLKKDIAQGQKILKDDIFFAMPCQDGQTTSGDFKEGIAASKDYRINQPLTERPVLSSLNMVRNVIHEAKGMLIEAGIEIGDSFEVELSHHYGIEHFRQTGAILVSIINREYCKKLLIVLPGQKHPLHTHKIKEETFQVLYGDLEIVNNGIKRTMKAGDIQVVLRGEKHSFASVNGAIFEEISTTHVKGDSYYDDPVISNKDLMERKTILKEW